MAQLILNTRGSRLAIRDARWNVQKGDKAEQIAFNEVDSIVLHPATSLTWEAINQAIEQDTDVLFVNKFGKPVARVWGNRFGSISSLRKRQLAFAGTPAAVEWVRQLLSNRVEGMRDLAALLQALYPDVTKAAPDLMNDCEQTLKRLQALEVAQSDVFFQQVRGMEGSAARGYFRFVASVLPEQYRFTGRSQHPAKDTFNSLLNYALGMLYAETEGALLKAGLDPFIGILHRDEYNRPVLSYDLIEPFRIWAEYVVIHLCMQQVIFPEHFRIEPDGGVLLDEGGKRILITAMNEYLDDLIELRGLVRSRRNHIQLAAAELAGRIRAHQTEEKI